MTSEEIQIEQINQNIKGLQMQIEKIKKAKREVETSETILKLEQIIADLKGYKAWHERRLANDKRTA